MMLATVTFSAYFIVSYVMSIHHFDSVIDSIDKLNIIYVKDSCIDNVLTFLRENQIRNETVTLSENPGQSGFDYYLDRCLEKE